MSLAKKIAEWTLITIPIWAPASLMTWDILAHRVGSVTEYVVPRFGPYSTVIGPLLPSQIEQITYSVFLRGQSTEVCWSSSAVSCTYLIDSNSDGLLDKELDKFGIPRCPPIVTERQITTQDQSLYTRIVEQAKKQ